MVVRQKKRREAAGRGLEDRDLLEWWKEACEWRRTHTETAGTEGGVVDLVDGSRHILDYWEFQSDARRREALGVSDDAIGQVLSHVPADLKHVEFKIDPERVKFLQAAVAAQLEETVQRRLVGIGMNKSGQGKGNGDILGKHVLLYLEAPSVEDLAIVFLLKRTLKGSYENFMAYSKMLNLLLYLSWAWDAPFEAKFFMFSVSLILLCQQFLKYDSLEGLENIVLRTCNLMFGADKYDAAYVDWKSDAFVASMFLILMSQDRDPSQFQAFWRFGIIGLPYIFSVGEGTVAALTLAKFRNFVIALNKLSLLYFGWSSWASLAAAMLTFFPDMLRLLLTLVLSVFFSMNSTIRKLATR